MTLAVIDADLRLTEIDLVAEVWKCVRLPAIRAAREARGLAPRAPGLALTISRRGARLKAQASYATDEVLVTAPLLVFPREQVEELILHEVVHLAVGPRRGARKTGDGPGRVRRKRSHHGPEFRALLLEAAFERWPTIRGQVLNQGRTYDIDERVWRCVRGSV